MGWGWGNIRSLHWWGRGPRWWGPDRPSPGTGWPFSPPQGGGCCAMIAEPAGPVRFRAGLARLAKIMTRISVLTRKGVLTRICFTAIVSCGAVPASRASSFAFPLSPGSGLKCCLPPFPPAQAVYLCRPIRVFGAHSVLPDSCRATWSESLLQSESAWRRVSRTARSPSRIRVHPSPFESLQLLFVPARQPQVRERAESRPDSIHVC